MEWTHPAWGRFVWRGGWLTGHVAGVEVGLDAPEAVAKIEALGPLDAWAAATLPRVAGRMRAEALWSRASAEALVGSLRVLAVHARQVEERLLVWLRWDGRVDLCAAIAPDGEVQELAGHFDLASRSPSFVHRYFGLFEDRGVGYEATVDGLCISVDLPEAVALLEPCVDVVQWAHGLTRSAAAQIATCATRHWAQGEVDVVAAGLSLMRVSASWLDECIRLHYAWGRPLAVEARVRVRALPAGAEYRVDQPSIEVRPASVVLPPLGEVTLREEGGVATYEVSVGGVSIHFDDPLLASAAHAASLDLASLRAAGQEHAARSLLDTWRGAWREPDEPGDEATLQGRFALRSIEVDADGLVLRFDDGGAFLGHVVLVERREGAWGEATLEG